MTAIALAWARGHTRTDSLCRELGLKPVYVWRLGRVPRWGLPFKYLWQTLDTISALLRERPDAILVQTPPVFAAVLAIAYAAWRPCRIVIDTHSTALVAPKWRWTVPLHRWCSRQAALTLVHTPTLADQVSSWPASCETLAAPPIVCKADAAGERQALPDGPGAFSVVVPCSFDEDEPVAAILAAAAQLPDVHFTLTGDYRRLPPGLVARRPCNVRFAGYLPLAAYFDLLREADVVMALTTAPDTMQNGGLEAAWLERPVITSDTQALRKIFGHGTLFVDNSPESICGGVRAALTDIDQLQAGARRLRREFELEWQAKRGILRACLAGE